jgi:hypothetical protein
LTTWFRDPVLERDEEILWKHGANRTQSGWRAVGGRLILTSRRLLFEPYSLDAALGGMSWSASLASIHGVGTQPRDRTPFSGGLRTRLRIDVESGIELFVVSRLDQVVKLLSEAVVQAG